MKTLRQHITQAVAVWTGKLDDEHVLDVATYLHYTGRFDKPQARDLSPSPTRGDPLYVVYAFRNKLTKSTYPKSIERKSND